MMNPTMRSLAVAAVLTTGLMTGCKSREQQALDQAKVLAANTHTAQQIQYVDKNGDTVTTIVQPPIAGQPQQVTSSITSPPPGPPPARTNPKISPYGTPVGSALYGTTPINPDGTPVANGNAISTPPSLDAGGSVPAPAEPAQTPFPAAVRVAAGTSLAIRLNQTINVKTARAGDRFSGVLADPVESDGAVVIPRGTPVSGRIDESHRRGHFKGRSVLELRLTAMTLNGTSYEISTHDHVNTKKGKGKRTAGFIGGLAGAGALIGGLASGGAGLAIGAASGAGAGTLLAGTTGNRDLVLPAETIVRFRLSEPIYLQ